ncbi:hypothetical protein [Yoonia sp. 2307UL14-13]|uniref:hypothetical protein n=1 Tax=Yoonia sp. 2307UL14-13 TaxID=3126506 RepID=UPI0030A0DD3A
MRLRSRDPKHVDILEYDGSNWNVARQVTSRGTARSNPDGSRSVWINRGEDCAQTQGTFFHEELHTRQPATMSSRDKEIEAHVETERWQIARGVPGSPSRRTTDAQGREVPDVAAITRQIDRSYGYSQGAPRIIGRSANGQTVTLEDGTTRAAQSGDRMQRQTPGQNLCEEPIDPALLTCP